MPHIVKSLIFAFLLVAALTLRVSADESHPRGIRLDGTIGTAGKLDLPGPDYEIRAEHGRQVGTNLFHSFGQFNLRSDEQATFTGPDNLRNIIGRVTGGKPSWIDGTLSTSVPHADLYLLNSAGIMFGPNASLDLSASFHVSTADYLRLGANDRFATLPLKSDVLSGAAPAAFGFLDHDIAPISAEGKGHIPREEWEGMFSTGLVVPGDKTLSLIGGDIRITKGSYTDMGDEQHPVGSLAIMEKGQICLASVAAPGEVIPTDAGPDVSLFEQLGNITVSEESALHVGGGKIFIRGGNFFLDKSYVNAGQTIFPENGLIGGNNGYIDIQADTLTMNDSLIMIRTYDEGDAGNLRIHASESVQLSESAIISASSEESGNAGNAGNIEIITTHLSCTDDSGIDSSSHGGGKGGDITITASESAHFSGGGLVAATLGQGEAAGNAGNILINTNQLSLAENAAIDSSTLGKGNGGNIVIAASESVLLSDSAVASVTFGPDEHAGDAGNVLIRTEHLSLTDNGEIGTMSWGGGEGGDVTLQASGAIEFSGTDEQGFASNVHTFAYGEIADAGDAGKILIEANAVSFRDGGGIRAGTRGSGDGGTIRIRAAESVAFTGVNPHGENSIGFGSGIDAPTLGHGEHAGKAGDIIIETGSLSVTHGARITSSTGGRGDGGEMHLTATESVLITGHSPDLQMKAPLESQLAFQEAALPSKKNISGIYSHTASTEATAGDAGGITITTPDLVISDRGGVCVSSEGMGNAGLVAISAGQITLHNHAFLSSTSTAEGQSGDGGLVAIRAGEGMEMRENSSVSTSTAGEGNAGGILMAVSRLEMDGGSSVSSASTAPGKGGEGGAIIIGNITGEAPDGSDLEFRPCESVRMRNHAGISTATFGEGNAGVVVVGTAQLDMDTGASVSSASQSPGKGGTGGLILINADTGRVQMQNHASISTSTSGEGDATGIGIQVSQLELDNGAHISSASTSPGNGGDAGGILIGREIVLTNDKGSVSMAELVQQLLLGEGPVFDETTVFSVTQPGDAMHIRNGSYVSTSSAGKGEAGDMTFHFTGLEIDTRSAISSASTSEFGGGDAGAIDITAADLFLENRSTITTEASGAGGGEMNLRVGDQLHLSDSEITTSVRYGAGNGGDIRVLRPEFVTLNHSHMAARADQGAGGNIRIVTDHFIRSSDSVVDASSRKGIDGTIHIDSPDSDMSSDLVILPVNFLNVSRWVRTPCEKRPGDTVSRLTVTRCDAAPTPLDDLHASPPLRESE